MAAASSEADRVSSVLRTLRPSHWPCGWLCPHVLGSDATADLREEKIACPRGTRRLVQALACPDCWRTQAREAPLPHVCRLCLHPVLCDCSGTGAPPMPELICSQLPRVHGVCGANISQKLTQKHYTQEGRSVTAHRALPAHWHKHGSL